MVTLLGYKKLKKKDNSEGATKFINVLNTSFDLILYVPVNIFSVNTERVLLG